jgi:MFS-type transporter involved in bile tolerance (Atg22 family)
MRERERTYRRRIRAWTLYDWANSAFATTILAAVLPVYYSQVAGSTLPGPSVATAYWSAGLSLSIFLGALLAPVLGTLSDIIRGKKLFLSLFAGLGVVCTGLLVLVKSGDWLLASLLFVFGRLGFGSSIVFYDALLPHVARPEDQDSVSTRGYALGYLGGGILLAVNVAMIRLLPGTWGPRLSFASVALWWALFSIPVLAVVPEPRTLTARPKGQGLLEAAFRRLGQTLRETRRYRELFRYLLAYLVYVDGIGTIIGVAAIYGAELGLGSVELILALLLVQFVGIPFSLIFGSLPRPEGEAAGTRRARLRPVFLGFVLANLVLLPALGLLGTRFLPRGWTGATPPPYAGGPGYAGQGLLPAEDPALVYFGSWAREQVDARTLNARADREYRISQRAGDRLELRFHGQRLVLTYAAGPDFGIWHVELDGRPLAGEDGRPLILNCYSPAARWNLTRELSAASPGLHTLALSNNGEKDTRSAGTRLALGAVRVLEPKRRSSLPLVLGLILALETACLGLAFLCSPLLSGLAARLSTKASLVLALAVYAAIAVYGYFLDSVLDYWCLAWLVACVQGGSQALSRSLFASMIPAAKSGEFFSLFGIMEKFATLLGPLVFAGAAALFGSSRPAVLSLILFFLAGIVLLLRVRVQEGRAAARAEEQSLKGSRPAGF